MYTDRILASTNCSYTQFILKGKYAVTPIWICIPPMLSWMALFHYVKLFLLFNCLSLFSAYQLAYAVMMLSNIMKNTHREKQTKSANSTTTYKIAFSSVIEYILIVHFFALQSAKKRHILWVTVKHTALSIKCSWIDAIHAYMCFMW